MRATASIWALLILLGMIWGASFMSVKLALTGFGPITVAAIRISFAAIFLMLWARATGRQLAPFTQRKLWLHIAGFAMFSNVFPFILLSWGQLHVTSQFAGISMAAVPLLVLPLAHALVPAERMNVARLAGFLAGFAGVAILIGPGVLASSGVPLEGLAQLACIAAAACYAIGSIITRTAPETGMVSYSAAALGIAALVILPLALAVEGLPRGVPMQALAAIAYLAILPTAAATLIMVHIIRNAGSTFLSLVNYQVPIWSVIFGAIVLGESLPGRFLGALALILTGVAISQIRRPPARP